MDFFKKILLGVAISMYFFTIMLCGYVSNYSFPVAQPIQIDKTKLKSFHYTTHVEGGSMTEYGYPASGGEAYIYPNQECNIGDNCAFRCKPKDDCFNIGSDINDYNKHVLKKSGNCYYFVGNKNDWKEGNFIMTSWDSTKYGWVCNVQILGKMSDPL